MSPEEKIAAAERLIAEAKAELAAKKRNWPEKIEPGMLFRYLDKVWIAMSATGRHPCDTLVSLESGFTYALHNLFNGRDQLFDYLGHARDLVKIADDAHEPTGARLVGRVCQVSLSPIENENDGFYCRVTSFDPILGYRTKEGEDTPWKYAKLAR